jgi:ATPase involved in DNA replication initiation
MIPSSGVRKPPFFLPDKATIMLDKDPLPRQLILDFPTQSEYSFSNFIVSDGSKIAFDAARQFCSDSSPFNTLYFLAVKI